jgi:flagellar P-ring protein precursor FlgI
MAFSMSRTRFSSYRHVLQAAMLAAGLLLAPASQAERI